MPTSHMHQLNEIVEVIRWTNPQTVLDVGVGFGKYGVLAREYLELRDGREQYRDWQRRIDGIEAFADYITPLHAFIYDNVYVADAAELLPKLDVTYDLILLIDVLEHFTRKRGSAVLQACCQKGRNVLISTPSWFFRQGEAFNNPYEQHLSFWSKADFSAFPSKCFIANDVSLICFVGAEAPLIRQKMLHPGRRFRQSFPFLKRPYRAMKKLFS